MAKLFISYSRKDKETIYQIAESLEAEYLHQVWIDKEDIAAGDVWNREILKGIEQSDVFIFFASEHSLGSINCKEEIQLAIDQNKPRIPVLLHGTVPEKLKAVALDRIQALDYGDAHFIERLDEAVNKKVQEYYQRNIDVAYPPTTDLPNKEAPNNADIASNSQQENATAILNIHHSPNKRFLGSPLRWLRDILRVILILPLVLDVSTQQTPNESVFGNAIGGATPTAMPTISCPSVQSQRSRITANVGASPPSLNATIATLTVPNGTANACALPSSLNGQRVTVGGSAGNASTSGCNLYLLIYPYVQYSYNLAYVNCAQIMTTSQTGDWSTQVDLGAAHTSYDFVLVAAQLGSDADNWLQNYWRTDICGTHAYDDFLPDNGGHVPQGTLSLLSSGLMEVDFISVSVP